MKTYNIEAFVLKNNNYSDADKLFTLFTKDFGKGILKTTDEGISEFYKNYK